MDPIKRLTAIQQLHCIVTASIFRVETWIRNADSENLFTQQNWNDRIDWCTVQRWSLECKYRKTAAHAKLLSEFWIHSCHRMTLHVVNCRQTCFPGAEKKIICDSLKSIHLTSSALTYERTGQLTHVLKIVSSLLSLLFIQPHVRTIWTKKPLVNKKKRWKPTHTRSIDCL